MPPLPQIQIPPINPTLQVIQQNLNPLWCCEAFAEDRDKGLAHEFERADAVLFRFKIRTRFWVIVERDVG